jgi:hypothetical protein
MAAIDITGAGGGGTAITVSATSPVVSTLVGSNYDISLDQTQFKTINGNSIFGAGNIVISAVLTNWTEAFASGTQATSSFTALNAATNVNAALVPKGTGAIVANVPNGAASGGNARGQYAVDLQGIRTVNIDVASGDYSVISGGVNNRNSGFTASCVGGNLNNISGKSGVIGGQQNTLSDEFSVVFGFLNSTSIKYGGVLSGQSNSSSSQEGALIVGGSSNSVTGNYSVCVSGNSNTISGSNAAVLIGNSCVASQNFSIANGWFANAYIYGQNAHANGRFTITGDAQGSEAIYRLNSGFTNGQTKEIFLDGASVRLTPFTNSALTINFDVVAIVTAISGTATGVTVGDMFSQNEIVALKNVAGTTTVVGSHSIYNLHDASMSSCDTTYLNTGTALAVNFNGPSFAGGGTVTLRIVVKARIVETRY